MNVLVVGLLCSSIGLAVSKVLTTLRFFREFILGLFIWICVFFEDLRVASFSACFISKLLVFWACFLQISCVADSFVYFQILWQFCCLIHCTAKCIFRVRFCVNMLILGLFLGFVYPWRFCFKFTFRLWDPCCLNDRWLRICLAWCNSNKRSLCHSNSMDGSLSLGARARGYALRLLCQWFSVRLSSCHLYFFSLLFSGLGGCYL